MPQHLTHLVSIFTVHDAGEGDLSLEHLPAVHQLDQQVAHCFKLHLFGRLDVRQDQARENLSTKTKQRHPIKTFTR